MPLAKKIDEPKVSSDDKLPKVVLAFLFLLLVAIIIMGLMQ